MTIAERIAAVEERIALACARSGRRREEVRLMAVSKFQGADPVEEAWRGGIRLFGESRVQEAVPKFGVFRETHPGCEVHFIGNLQRNKAKGAALFFDLVQSVGRDELALELSRHVPSGRGGLGLLLELNAGEESKSGYPDEDSLFRGAEKILSLPGLRPEGLMTLAPLTDDGAAVRRAFRALAHAREGLERRFPEARWSCLSMGMSGDFEIAVEEGSTLVRIGTAIFGGRTA